MSVSGRGWITSGEWGRTDGSREGGESARDTKTNGERDGRKSERRREERKAARLGIRVRRWKSSEYGVTAELNEQTRPQRLALIASSTTRPPQFTGTNGRFPCLAACACISVETSALSWRAEELLMLRASLAPGRDASSESRWFTRRRGGTQTRSSFCAVSSWSPQGIAQHLYDRVCRSKHGCVLGPQWSAAVSFSVSACGPFHFLRASTHRNSRRKCGPPNRGE